MINNMVTLVEALYSLEQYIGLKDDKLSSTTVELKLKLKLKLIYLL